METMAPQAERTPFGQFNQEPARPGPLQVQPPTPQFSLAPRNLTEAMEFAQMMAQSELVPKHFRGKPGDVLIAVQMGNEIGLAPMAAIQNIAVINGKPGIYGDAGKAVLLRGGCIIEEDDVENIKRTGRARCKITRKGRPPVERTFSEEDAKKAGLWNKDGPWKTYPYRQMAWRAFWFAARDAAADMLKGLGGAEELSDIPMQEINPRNGAAVAAAARGKPEDSGERSNAIAKLREIASTHGTSGYAAAWQTLTPAQRKMIGPEAHAELKALAASRDADDAEVVA